MRGIMPLRTPPSDDSSDFARNRLVLRDVWNTKKYEVLASNNFKPATGSFRATMNAGDLLSRQNYSCGGGSQVNSRPGLFGLNIGGIHDTCDGTNIPPSTCNVKFVYDSSDFTRFKKEKALNKNYNDKSSGGDQSNASQVAFRTVRG